MGDSVAVEFVYLWPCKVSEWESMSLGDAVFSPIFRAVHNGVGLDWRLKVYPKGNYYVTEEFMVLELQFTNFLDDPCTGCATCDTHPARGTWAWSTFFVSVGDEKKATEDFDEIIDDYGIWVSEFLSIVDPKNFELEYCENGVITLGVSLTIPTSEFTITKLIPAEIAPTNVDRMAALFSAVKCLEDDSKLPPKEKSKVPDSLEELHQGPKRPTSDKYKTLDFCILTSDSKVIWCHKIVLVTFNEKFATFLGSELKESEVFLKVPYESDLMMEVLHNIYKQAPSPNFEGLVLNDITDLANYYDLPNLKLRCQKQFIKQLSVQNSAEFLELAHRYEMKFLKNMAINLITENMEEVRRSEKGKEMRECLWLEVMEANDKIRRVVKMPFGSPFIYECRQSRCDCRKISF